MVGKAITSNDQTSQASTTILPHFGMEGQRLAQSGNPVSSYGKVHTLDNSDFVHTHLKTWLPERDASEKTSTDMKKLVY